MERALNLAGLKLALGDHEALPSAATLQRLIADTETSLFVQRNDLPAELVSTAWYLHGIASSPEALARYERDRQLRAFQVSAHVFDLALADSRLPATERLRLAFAAQVGYRRCGLEPNAMAMFPRVRGLISSEGALIDHVSSISLEAGVSLLGFRPRVLFPLFRSWLAGFDELRDSLGLDDIRSSPFGMAASVVEGCNALLRFLTLGEEQERPLAAAAFAAAVQDGGFEVDDIDSRWVAAQLRWIADDAEGTSVWTALPPSVPPAARRSLTLSAPPVLTLWEPQARLLSGAAGSNPLAPDTRRAVLAIPTGAGKTLTAQILMVDHLATGIGTVCFVAPMRSLAREVRAAMRGRLRMLRRELGRDLPDYADWGIEQSDVDPVGVEVMTPERLMQLVRRDADEVLSRFTMFIFDEAHMLAEAGRGPLLEQLISFLHWKTLETHHRIVLLSAALGNRGEVMAWLDPTGVGAPYYSDWRGPRRLHAIYSTRRDDSSFEVASVAARNEYTVRKTFPLRGLIRLKPAEEMAETRLQFVNPVGVISFRETPTGRRSPGSEKPHSTPGYVASAHMAAAVAHGGPVLVVMSSRVMARQMARAIADIVDPRPGTRALTTLVRDQLGPDHPLVEVLPYGVGYHHGGLPTDILEALEEGLRTGVLGWMVATSTLTEGVNLPVRTVVIAETRYDGQPVEAQLRGARLVNAMGRAGRATQESEGWIVLCLQAAPNPSDFARFNPTDDQLRVSSQLGSDSALVELAAFEDEARAAEDAVYRFAGDHVRGFIAYVWFVLANDTAHTEDVEQLAVSAVETLFGFHQLDEPARRRWRAVAKETASEFIRADPQRRVAWARTGTSIGTARRLDRFIDQVVAAVMSSKVSTPPEDPYEALSIVEATGFFADAFDFPESPRTWGFRPNSNARLENFVTPSALAVDWLRGVALPEMASTYLAAITKVDVRVEQMVDVVTECFEHYLAWMLGILVEAVNQALSGAGHDRLLCPDLPLFMRYGVDTPAAVGMATDGVRSRRLLHAVTARATFAERDDVEEWLSEMSIADWREQFDATSVDILDLLDFTRAKSGALLPDLLETGGAEVTLSPVTDDLHSAEAVTLGLVASDPVPQRLGAFDGNGRLVAVVPPREHGGVAAVLDTGLPLVAELTNASLRLTLLDAEDF
jgi:hypothetical protein